MALPKPTGAIARLTGANNNSYDATTNPLGLADGGHRQNWVPNAQAEVDVAQWVESLAGDVKADADRFEAAVEAIEAGPVTSVNGRSGAVTGLAETASPAFTGTPTAPTQAAGNNSTRLATTAFVKTALDGLSALAPIVVSSPPDNTTASSTQTFVAKLQGYTADTLGYYSLYGYPQASRALNVYLPSSPSVIFKATGPVAGAGNSLSVNLQTLGLAVGTDYLAEIVLTDVLGNTTKSAKSRFTTPAQFKPSVGDAFQGGTVVAVDFVDGSSTVHLIRMPKAQGETNLAFYPGGSTPAATGTSRTNGLSNQEANKSAYSLNSFAAQKFTDEATINGYSDIYLPAIQELLVARSNNSSLPAAERFDAVTYLASTEVTAAIVKISGPANEEQNGDKSIAYRVAAFRRVAA